MAAVHRHLDDLVDAGTPASEKRELQQAARQARQAFMQASRGADDLLQARGNGKYAFSPVPARALP
jgi:phytoene/squalene synthetase